MRVGVGAGVGAGVGVGGGRVEEESGQRYGVEPP